MDAGWTLFDSAIGAIGLAWSGHRLRALQLPQAQPTATAAHLAVRHPDLDDAAAPPWVEGVVRSVVALCDGRAVDFSTAPELDLDRHGAFERSVWGITRRIPFGETMTYGQIARALGDVRLARAVGAALGANPVPIIVPCHRVLGAEGATGGFSGAGGVETKLRLLTIERASTSPEPMLFDDLPFVGRSKRRN